MPEMFDKTHMLVEQYLLCSGDGPLL